MRLKGLHESDTDGAQFGVVALYRREMDVITGFGGIPILLQTSKLHWKSAKEKAAALQFGKVPNCHLSGHCKTSFVFVPTTKLQNV